MILFSQIQQFPCFLELFPENFRTVVAVQLNGKLLNILKSFWQRLLKHALNYCQYIVSDTDKHFKFDLDKKLNPWLKFQPNFLTWLPKGKMEKQHSVSSVFLIHSIFTNGNQISLFSRKAYDNLTGQWLEKMVGCPCLLVSYSYSSIDRAQHQGKSAMFSICAYTMTC